MDIQLELNQKQTISQQMVQSMEILQMSAQELESYIERLSQENPVIDFPDSDPASPDSVQEDLQRKLDWLESTDYQNKIYYQQDRSAADLEQNWCDQGEFEDNLSDYLFSQILLSDYTFEEREVIEFMIQSIDSRGYYKEDCAAVARRFAVSEQVVQELLEEIQSLDPAGVGARDLRECLLLQIQRKRDRLPLTETLIRDYLGDMAKKRFSAIAKKLSVSLDDIDQSWREIQSLNPKPGNSFSDRELLYYISPDVLVIKFDTGLETLINEYQYPRFTINSYYQDLLKQTADPETRNYLQEKITQAQWVSRCIAQRTSTLSKVVHLLVKKQYDFFVYGPGHKRPLKLADMAEELNLHVSTVSRAMRGKYLQCSWGVFPLNFFLTSVAVRNGLDGEEKTQEQLKILIRRIIDGEDKHRPLSDQAISDTLRESDICLSRRTVNKYRTEMNIPDKSGRKSFL